MTEFKKEFLKPEYKGKHIFAHNAEFDLMVIYGNIFKNLDNTAVFNGRFVMATNGNCIFVDSFNIFDCSVKNLGKSLGMEKIENTKVFTEGLTKSNITNEDITYCIRDCEIVYKALHKMFNYAGSLKITISSLAMFNFRSRYLNKPIFFEPKINDLFYNSYCGGRTEVFKLGECDCKTYDINSMYPKHMRDGTFPNPFKMKHQSINQSQFLYLLRYYEGVADITIRHREHYLGYLPVKHNEKLIFPNGVFRGWFNFCEVKNALDKQIIDIIEVHDCIFSRGEESPFRNYIDDHYQKKETATGIDRLIEKKFLNTLYGRFAMKRHKKTVYFEDIPIELINQMEREGTIFELKYFNSNRNDLFIDIIEEMQNYNSIPSYSSYITSLSRINLLDGLEQNLDNSVRYCDTDSIFCDGNFKGKISDNLGDWKEEDKKVTMIRGLKNYDCEVNNTKEVHIKGVGKNAIEIEENVFLDRRYIKTKQALRQGKEAGKSIEVIKKLKNTYDKRIIESNGVDTRPIILTLNN